MVSRRDLTILLADEDGMTACCQYPWLGRPHVLSGSAYLAHSCANRKRAAGAVCLLGRRSSAILAEDLVCDVLSLLAVTT